MKRSRFGPAAWALLDQAVVSATNFLSGILIARSLDASGLATYSLAVTTIFGLFTIHRALIAQPLNILGVQESVERRWGRFENMVQVQWRVLPLTALLLAGVGALFFPRWGVIWAAMVYVSLFCLQELMRRYHYTAGQIRQALPGDMLAYWGQLAVLGIAWHMHALTVDSVLWLMSVPLALATGWMYWQIRRCNHVKAPVGTPGPLSELVGHWEHAKWVVLSQLVWIGATQIIPFQLSLFAHAGDVASFYAVSTLLNGLNVIRLTIGNYLPTRAAAILSTDGKLALRRYLFRVSLMVLAFSVFVWLCVLIFGDWAIALIFSGKYEQAGQVLPALAAVNLLALLALVSAAGAQILGVSKVMFTSNLLAMVLCLVVGPWAVSQAGLWGAVLIAAIGLLLPTVMQGIRVSQALRD